MRTLNSLYRGLFSRRAEEPETNERESKKGLGKRFGWLVTLDAISNHRPETWEHYYKMGVVEFLNIVSYYHAKQQEEKNRRDLEKLKNGY